MKNTIKLTALLLSITAMLLAGCPNDTTNNDNGKGNGNNLKTLSGAIAITPNSGVVIGTELTATYNGNESISYQWKNGSTNVGTDSNKFTPTAAGSYTVTVSATGYNPKTSAAVTVTIPIFNTPAAFKTWLDNDAQPGNTPATAYTVVLNVNSLGGNANITGSVGDILKANNGKYVYLDLSDSALTNIEDYAFDNCSTLTGITIPDNVTSIGRDAFRGTAWLNNQPNGLVYLGKAVLMYKDKDTMPVNTPISLNNGTKVIANHAFSRCDNLVSVIIPNSVTNIGDSAFFLCTGLTGVTIPNSVTNIGNSAFSNCTNTSFVSVTIPNSVTSIGDMAFKNCTNLASVTIGTGVKNIGDDAFDTNNLTNVMFQGTIPSSGFSATAFLGNLRDKFYATNTTNGTPGTYTTTAPVSASSTWMKQP